MARTLKTARQDIYKRLVKDDDEENTIFKYNYELFSLGAIYGYFHGDQKAVDEEERSQDFIKVSDITPEEHRQSIELVYQMVKIESEQSDESEIWKEVLKYADRGVELIDEGISTQGDFDLVGIVQGANAEDWESRLIDSLGDPGELEGVRPK
ncbi:hypothetical protein NP511_04675 [Natrinema thermotolerans]|uniref:Uncharacterized protein n=1 Tax=Natrinema thermotolerans TaxID=121872 RepID=A0AAF0T2B4_9EURY|nr:hypothetical protein [Natrinema thermotolerans]QCC57837.1 hypothetical protein DVR14_03945 [Natrinema thermotolerans]WMT08928.1 hypothetical protein NP511_04675 [Natrinema thermotolerans]